MPKSPSRTSKKKKYNARFPPARIKKIMQTDEEVGKVAAAVPVIISRALELFIESLIIETSKTTWTKNAKTLSTSHIKQTIETNKQFDFLRDLVASIPDHQAEDNNGDMAVHDGETAGKKGRGRPRKAKEVKEGGRNRGESSKASSNTSDEDDDEEDDEETETDEEDSVTSIAATSSAASTSSATQGIMENADRLIHSSFLAMSHLGSKSIMDSPLNLRSSTPQPFNNPAVGSVQQQSHQQQYASSNLPSYSAPPYPTFVSSPPQGMTSFPISSQFPNSYPPMMPLSQHQYQLPTHQHPGSHYQQSGDQQFYTQAHIKQEHMQPQPNVKQEQMQPQPNVKQEQMQPQPNVKQEQMQPQPNVKQEQMQPQPHVKQEHMQPQPMNLSYSSWATTTAANENDDYDT